MLNQTRHKIGIYLDINRFLYKTIIPDISILLLCRHVSNPRAMFCCPDTHRGGPTETVSVNGPRRYTIPFFETTLPGRQ